MTQLAQYELFQLCQLISLPLFVGCTQSFPWFLIVHMHNDFNSFLISKKFISQSKCRIVLHPKIIKNWLHIDKQRIAHRRTWKTMPNVGGIRSLPHDVFNFFVNNFNGALFKPISFAFLLRCDWTRESLIRSKLNCVQITIDSYSIVLKCIGISIQSRQKKKQFEHIYRKQQSKTKQKQFSYETQSNQLFGGLFTELCKLEPSVRFIRRQNDEWISVVGAAVAVAIAVCVVYAI